MLTLPPRSMFRPALTASLLALALSACSSGDDAPALDDETPLVSLNCTQFAPPGTTVAPVKEGLLCTLLGGLVCDVTNPERVADGNPTSFANVSYRLGLLDVLLGGASGVQVTLPSSIPAGQLAAFDIHLGASTLDLSLGRTVNITTWLHGTEQESRGTGTLLTLDVLGIPLAGDNARGLVGFVNQKPYDQIAITLNAALLAVDLSPGAKVHELCLNGRPAP